MIEPRALVLPGALRLASVAVALAVAGCYGGGDGSTPYVAGGPVACKSGVQSGSIDTGALLELDPGSGVGATVEYVGDGGWRFAVTCDTLKSGYGCRWTLLVSSIDGSIESYTPEALENEDLIEFYPTVPGSTVEDGVLLDSLTDVNIDAFTVLATPGAGMRVSAFIGDDCGGPYLFWTDAADVVHSSTNPTDLFPSE